MSKFRKMSLTSDEKFYNQHTPSSGNRRKSDQTRQARDGCLHDVYDTLEELQEGETAVR